jgi:hypothetical protein
LYEDVLENKINIWSEFERDPDYIKIRRKFNTEFYENYNAAFANYVSGKWDRAKIQFMEAEVELFIIYYILNVI